MSNAQLQHTSDKKSLYLAECFNVGLCGLFALKWPHKHHKGDNRHTTYQVKVDVPIAHNEINGKLGCDVIIAVLERVQVDTEYVYCNNTFLYFIQNL